MNLEQSISPMFSSWLTCAGNRVVTQARYGFSV